jgi:two-component system sensor histidine kinase RegB
VVAPHRNFGIAIDVTTPADRNNEPAAARNPAILYGLGNIVENAVDFARDRVEIGTQWNDEIVAVTIADDGPGFAPEILNRIGEPYVSSRRRKGGDSEESGLGRGLFIAKTLLERTGGTLTYKNRGGPARGAIIAVRWRREDFERLPDSSAV